MADDDEEEMPRGGVIIQTKFKSRGWTNRMATQSNKGKLEVLLINSVLENQGKNPDSLIDTLNKEIGVNDQIIYCERLRADSPTSARFFIIVRRA